MALDLTATAAANGADRRAVADDLVSADATGTLGRFRDLLAGSGLTTNVMADKVLPYDAAGELLDAVTSADLAPALRAGMAHGWHCIGCCWALMVVFLVVGVMNLFWMAVIAGIFLVDKHWSHGEGLTRLVGIGFVLLGLVVVVSPDLLAFISGVAATGPAPMPTM